MQKNLLQDYFLGNKERSNSSLLPSLTVGPSLYYISKGTGQECSEKWQFMLTFSTIYADVGQGEWVGQKKSENMLT